MKIQDRTSSHGNQTHTKIGISWLDLTRPYVYASMELIDLFL